MEKESTGRQHRTRTNTGARNKKRKSKSFGKFKYTILKWLLIVTCLFLSIILGLMVGYSVLGDGSPLDVLKIETWKHIYDLVFTYRVE